MHQVAGIALVACGFLLSQVLLWGFASQRIDDCLVDPAPPASAFLVSNVEYFAKHDSPYSAHYCTGGDGSIHQVDPFSRRCIFKNVIWLRRKRTLVYQQDPNLPTADFSQWSRGFSVYVHVVTNSTPRRRVLEEEKEIEAACHVFAHECELGGKVGHDFDSVWNAFLSLLSLRMLSPHNKLLVAGKRHRSGEYAPLSKMWATLAKQYHRVEDFYPSGQVLSCAVVANKHRAYITFPTFSSAYEPQLYLDRTFAVLGMPKPAYVPTPTHSHAPLILIRFKEHGKHGFIPHEEIVQFLRETYPRCQVKELIATRDSALRDELELISQAAVYLTPGGGGSFTGVFLPPGATAIYGNVCWKGNSWEHALGPESFGLELIRRNGLFAYCVRQDNFVWTLFNHYEKRYISALQAADIFSPVNHTKAVYNRVLRHSFTPNYTDLKSYMDEALIRVGLSSYVPHHSPSRPVWTKEQQQQVKI